MMSPESKNIGNLFATLYKLQKIILSISLCVYFYAPFAKVNLEKSSILENKVVNLNTFLDFNYLCI